jgi:hypothetical protein
VNVRSMLTAAVFACTAIAVAACGGGGGSTYSPPTPGPTCAPPSGVQWQLIYPAPGATKVPDALSELVFAASSPLPSSWGAAVNTSSSLNGSVPTYNGLQTISASQVPTPSATPAFANPVYQAIPLVNSLPSGATIYVWLNNTASNCTPAGPLGSFQTQ